MDVEMVEYAYRIVDKLIEDQQDLCSQYKTSVSARAHEAEMIWSYDRKNGVTLRANHEQLWRLSEKVSEYGISAARVCT